MKMQAIFTVVIIPESSGEISTASFINYDDAANYIVEEIMHYDEEADVELILDELEECRFIYDGTCKYYLEDANLTM